MQSYLDDLPEELMVNILSRVPAKSVGRCRCVSKPWRSLLLQPTFIRTHLNLSKNTREETLVVMSFSPFCLWSASWNNANHLLDEITITAEVSLAGRPDSYFKPICSCDGLVLLGISKCERSVLNPVTREIRNLPPSPLHLDLKDNCMFSYGFGYDSANDEYKIVILGYYYKYRFDYDDEEEEDEDEDDSTETFVNVYSLKSGSWKKVESCYDHKFPSYVGGVLVNGCIHWLTARITESKKVIVAFDLVKQKFNEVPPPISLDNRQLWSISVLRGCLCVSSKLEFDRDVWVMKKYGAVESWIKFTIDVPRDLYGDGDGDGDLLVCMLGREQLVLMKFGELLVYNLEDKTLKHVVIHGFPFYHQTPVSYMESLLALLNEIDDILSYTGLAPMRHLEI